MPITQITINNYKSLKSVVLKPTPLSVIVGANGSGKTNFADCLDFIGDVYRHGLEVAVSRKGGYENIAFRRQQRSKLPIKIHLIVELSPKELGRILKISDDLTLSGLNIEGLGPVRVEHSFEFAAKTRSIRSDFKVTNETLCFSEKVNGLWRTRWTLNRDPKSISLKAEPAAREEGTDGTRRSRTTRAGLYIADMIRDAADLRYYTDSVRQLPQTELITSVAKYSITLLPLLREGSAVHVFQINPVKSREVGVPTPTPELDRSGGNLPAVIDQMKKLHPEAWQSVMEVIRTVLPDLKEIDVDYTPSKRLGLFFREEGYGRSWSVEEISDGTLQTLALTVTIFDPDSSILVLEELENSVHPWIIRRILDACVEASKTKQIILTTHSPIVINAVPPDNIWVISRKNGESHLDQLSQLDPNVVGMWAGGDISTFDYIDSGALPDTTPPLPSEEVLAVKGDIRES